MCPHTAESTNCISSTSICQIAVCHSSGAIDSSLVGCDVVQIGKHFSRDEDGAARTASADLLSGPLVQTTPQTSYTKCPRLLVAMGATVTFHDIRFAQHLKAARPHYGQLRVSGTERRPEDPVVLRCDQQRTHKLDVVHEFRMRYQPRLRNGNGEEKPA